MIDKLEMLIALAREQHFGHAAAAYGVSQPALSNAVKQLEGSFGVELKATRLTLHLLQTKTATSRAILNFLIFQKVFMEEDLFVWRVISEDWRVRD